MTANVGSKLVDQLNDLHGLHDRKHHGAIVLAHHDLSGTAKSSTNRDRTSAVIVSGHALKFTLDKHRLTLLIDRFLVHCGFHETTTCPPDGTDTG